MFEALTISGGQEIKAENDGYMNKGFWGENSIVFDFANKFQIETLSANLLKVKSGTCSIQGRLGQIRPGNDIEIPVDNGVPGVTRTDLVVFEISKNGDLETFEIKILKGNVDTGVPVSMEKQDIYSGGNLYQAKLAEVQVTSTGIEVVQDYSDVTIQASASNLVERGENENGSWEKWWDGTLICWGEIVSATFTSAGRKTTTKDFPVAFVGEISDVHMTSTTKTSRPDEVQANIFNTSVTQAVQVAYSSFLNNPVTSQYMAKGKWK